MTLRHAVLGTAGHIDHGKTSLVRALTGTDTDRLPEEKARGITIELGFARLDLPGVRLGVVDVPGHERFVRAMVAGATGIDLVLFVIAADEGIMPQTREHLAICELLGITTGVVALTKADLVEPEWLQMVTDEVRAHLATTFLSGAPIVPVSSTRGDGLDVLRDTIARLAQLVPARPESGLARLPVDRVFSVHGFGTVVTGTLVEGRLAVGDEVVAQPLGTGARIRGLETHGEPATAVGCGQRVAVNLGGVEIGDVPRGQTLTRAGELRATRRLEGRVTVLPALGRPLRSRSRVLLHAGTSQVEAEVTLLERAELAPGASDLAQLELASPLVVRPGDRFVLRGFVPLADHGRTLGGGLVLRTRVPRRRRADPTCAAALAALEHAPVVDLVAFELREAGAAGLSRAELAELVRAPAAAIDDALGRLRSGRACTLFDKAIGAHVHEQALADLEARLTSAVERFHVESPARPGASREELRSRVASALPPRVFQLALDRAVQRGALRIEADLVAAVRRAASAPLGAVTEALARLYAGAGLAPPRNQDLAEALGVTATDAAEALAALQRSGLVVRVSQELSFSAAALSELEARLCSHLDAHDTIDAAGMKALTGQSRKFTIPLGEYFDARKVTLRVGEIRKRRR